LTIPKVFKTSYCSVQAKRLFFKPFGLWLNHLFDVNFCQHSRIISFVKVTIFCLRRKLFCTHFSVTHSTRLLLKF